MMKRYCLLLFSLILTFNVCAVIAGEYAIEVYKSPYCGCCEKWVSHLEQNGFKVNSHNLENMQEIKSRFGISREIQSCHTAIIDGYFIEGHVPASDIKKLLSERPDIQGLSVPGMPAGSNVPGMETRPEKAKFDVLAVEKDDIKVYAHHE